MIEWRKIEREERNKPDKQLQSRMVEAGTRRCQAKARWKSLLLIILALLAKLTANKCLQRDKLRYSNP